MRLSLEHTRKQGFRTLDILHVAFAQVAATDQFIIADQRQYELAGKAGLRPHFVG